jgi:hypothetical protein
MKATITQIESVVTPSGNSGHVRSTKGLDRKRGHSYAEGKEEKK